MNDAVTKPGRTGATLVALFLGPVAGMANIRRGWLALLYMPYGIVTVAIPFLLAHSGVLTADPVRLLLPAGIIARLLATGHVWFLAARIGHTRPWYAHWAVIALVPLVAFGSVFVVRRNVGQMFTIPSSAMSPSLNPGDYLLVQPISVERQPLVRGEIIVFDKDGVAFVKRILGLPGDTIAMQSGVPIINGSPVFQQKSQGFRSAFEGGEEIIAQNIETLPGGVSYGVLNSIDNAAYDDVPPIEIPPQSYFVIGDNRDNSLDSRDLEIFGFVPFDAVIGKPIFLVFNGHEHGLAMRRLP